MVKLNFKEFSLKKIGYQSLNPLYTRCFNIHGYIGCVNTHGTYVTANNSTNNNIEFAFVSKLKIVYYNNY